MLKTITVHRHERVAVIRDGAYDRLLGPGRHTLWTIGSVVELVRYDIRGAPQRLDAGEILPEELDGARVLTVGRHEVGVLRVQGRDEQIMLPGRYRLWDQPISRDVVLYDTLAEPEPLAPDDVLGVGQVSAWVEAAADERSAVVLLRDGHPVRALARGRYRAWRSGPWALRSVSLERQLFEPAAQDVVTGDQVPVRVKAAVSLAVSEPVQHLREPAGLNLVYGAVQLALREVLAAHALDDLTQARAELSAALLQRSRAALPEVGLELHDVWIKDLILPGEIKALVNRVTLARKEAEAHAIKRREEVAATRQLANTAKLLETSPVLLRLKELEAMGELVGKIDKLVLVGGDELARQVRLRTAVDETA